MLTRSGVLAGAVGGMSGSNTVGEEGTDCNVLGPVLLGMCGVLLSLSGVVAVACPGGIGVPPVCVVLRTVESTDCAESAAACCIFAMSSGEMFSMV